MAAAADTEERETVAVTAPAVGIFAAALGDAAAAAAEQREPILRQHSVNASPNSKP